MPEGKGTFMGLAPPLYGEYEQKQQTAANDMVTWTGASGMTGDFLVLQDNSGTELFVLSAAGKPSLTLTSSAADGFNISISSTGAIDAGANTANAFLVSASSKSELNAIIGYNSGGGTEVGDCQTFFAVHGSKAPAYFISVGATAAALGAPTDNGFLETNLRYLAAPDTGDVLCGVKMLAGSMVVYLLAAPATIVEAA